MDFSFCICSNSVFFVLISTLLVSESYSWSDTETDEGACIEPLPEPAQFNTKWLIFALRSPWYVTIASKAYLHHLSTNLNGFPVTNTEEANKLCLQFTPATPMASITGYGNNSIADCKSNKIGHQECTVEIEDEKTHNKTEKVVKGVSSWTDNQSNIVITLCLTTGQKAWVILSTERAINTDNRQLMFQHIKSLGFKRELAQEVSYDGCDELLRLGAIKGSEDSGAPAGPSRNVTVSKMESSRSTWNLSVIRVADFVIDGANGLFNRNKILNFGMARRKLNANNIMDMVMDGLIKLSHSSF